MHLECNLKKFVHTDVTNGARTRKCDNTHLRKYNNSSQEHNSPSSLLSRHSAMTHSFIVNWHARLPKTMDNRRRPPPHTILDTLATSTSCRRVAVPAVIALLCQRVLASRVCASSPQTVLAELPLMMMTRLSRSLIVGRAKRCESR